MPPGVDTLAQELERHREPLLQLARGLLRSRPSIDAADVVQTTFGQAIQAATADIQDLESWLRGILRHRVIDAIRAADRRACQQLPSDKAGTSTSASGNAIKMERCQAVRDAVARLPQRERDVIELTYFIEWTQEEIRDHLGLKSRGQVAGLHFRGTKRLRRLLERAE